ncbi:unnamed protein product [Effrenium voratum]|nr:unnamed protein product [Effrenium voratum]
MVTTDPDEKPTPLLKEPPEARPSPLSRLRDFLRAVTCQRRQVKAQRYEQLLEVGRGVPERKREEWYDRLAWWSEVPTKKGAKVFVFAPRGPGGETEYPISMRELLGYALLKMDKVVVEEDSTFAVVWVQENDHRLWPVQAWRLSESLHERYGNNLEAVHVVHPSWTVRFLRLLFWPLASEEFWDYFQSHERVEFLDVALDMRRFRLPKDIVEYDKWLDKQAEELHKQQASKQGLGGSFGGGFGGGFGNIGNSDEERKKLEQQMEEMKRALAQKGYSGKAD